MDVFAKPNVFARRWIELMAGVGALAGGGMYYRDELDQYYTSGKERIFGKGGRSVSDQGPGGSEEGASVEDATDEEQRYDVDAEYKGYTEQLMAAKRCGKDLREIQDAIIDDKIKKSTVAWRMTWYYLGGVSKGFRSLARQGRGMGDDLGKKPGVVVGLLYYWAGVDEVKERAASTLRGLDSGRKENEEEFPFEIGDTVSGLFAMPKLWFYEKKRENPYIWAFLRSSPITVPLAWLGWKGYKMYKNYLPNCEPIRVALVDIALLLNVYGDASPEEMDTSDFGRLAYLAHKLKLDIGLVPKQYRESFLIEVGLLHTSSLNAQQKMKVIDLMYKKYPFLAFQGMTTA